MRERRGIAQMSISINIRVSLTFSLFLSTVFIPIFIFSVVTVVLIQSGNKAAEDICSFLLSTPKDPYLFHCSSAPPPCIKPVGPKPRA